MNDSVIVSEENKEPMMMWMKVMSYKHTLSVGNAVVLARMYHAGGKASLDALGLTFAQRTNAQKLQYWGLLVRQESGGCWELTSKGREYVLGFMPIHKHVWVRNKVVMGFEGDRIFFEDISEGYQHLTDYINNN